MSEHSPGDSQLSAGRIKKVEFAGPSSVVQLAGLVALFVCAYLGYRNSLNLLGTIDWSKKAVLISWLAGGFVLAAVLFIVGSQMATKYLCGRCQNLLSGKTARICPTCQTNLRDDP